jgi:hypothetical protein
MGNATPMTQLTTPLYRTFSMVWAGNLQDVLENETREVLTALLDRDLWQTMARPLWFPTLIELAPFE